MWYFLILGSRYQGWCSETINIPKFTKKRDKSTSTARKHSPKPQKHQINPKTSKTPRTSKDSLWFGSKPRPYAAPLAAELPGRSGRLLGEFAPRGRRGPGGRGHVAHAAAAPGLAPGVVKTGRNDGQQPARAGKHR